MPKFSKAVFEPLVSSVFTVQIREGQVLPLRLAGITSRQISPLFESFTLNFDPPQGVPALPDDSYLMTAEGFGPELIHMSATHAGTPDPNVYYYESVFNVLVVQEDADKA
ncbi:MAG: hypothetical protein M0T70_11865 [Geobacteraceae bacterium]|nr:hypothetical protein [Geobacteraceae bacterium]